MFYVFFKAKADNSFSFQEQHENDLKGKSKFWEM